MSERTIEVHVDAAAGPILAGQLFTRIVRGRESATFRYASEWLRHPAGFALDPVALPLGPGPFTTAAGQALFPGLADSAPDRWGRMLMQRAARKEGARQTLFESDTLLRVDDTTRHGALRLRLGEHAPFLAQGAPIPPLVRLGELLAAADRVQDDADDDDALTLLLAPGSSLGGARPKANVLDAHGALSMAKFSSTTDTWPVIRWEGVVSELAQRAGVSVPTVRVVELAGRAVLLSRRFDREGAVRRPFLSAMALIGASPGGEHSYLELAEGIRRHGSRVREDLAQLWRRIVFNVLVSNTDDHLRNHGFLRVADGWRLSPAYDLNPMPIDVRPRVHALALDESDPEASLATVRTTAAWFGLSDRDAATIVLEVATAVDGWREVARSHGLRRVEIDRMETAFEHRDRQEALRQA